MLPNVGVRHHAVEDLVIELLGTDPIQARDARTVMTPLHLLFDPPKVRLDWIVLDATVEAEIVHELTTLGCSGCDGTPTWPP